MKFFISTVVFFVMCFLNTSAQDTTVVLSNSSTISGTGIDTLQIEDSASLTNGEYPEEAAYEPWPWEILDTTAIDSATVVKWYSIEEAMLVQKTSGKKIFIEVYATWCKWCRAMNDSVFSYKEIAHYLNENYIPVKFNCEGRQPVQFKGKEYKYLSQGNSRVHELALYLTGNNESYPAFAILNEDGNLISMKQGYLDGIAFENYVNFYGSNAYIEVPYHEFESRFLGRMHR